MYAGWNLLIVVALLCGQSVGFFWPFTALAATNAIEEVPESGHKKVAIIGSYFLLIILQEFVIFHVLWVWGESW
jgi:hypothetical protein